ncbi:MAG: 2-oxo acid dehydrogenase subunit E2 [Eubacterium sp.]
MGERKVTLSKANQVVGAAMKKSVLSYGQCTGYVQTDFSDFLKFRRKMTEEGKKASMSAYFLKAMAIAMADFPDLNAILVSEKEIVIYDEINIGLGVHTDNGIMMVVVKDCGNKSVMEISADLEDKVLRAREGKLTLDDITGGTVSASNLSMTREDFFTSIIVGDQTMIIGFGGINKKPYVVNNEIVIRDVANIMVNMNHTSSQGYPTTMYLCKVAEIIENPETYFVM